MPVPTPALSLEGEVIAAPEEFDIRPLNLDHLLGHRIDNIVLENAADTIQDAVQPEPGVESPTVEVVGGTTGFAISGGIKVQLYVGGAQEMVISDMSWRDATTNGVYAKVTYSANGSVAYNNGTPASTTRLEWQAEYPYVTNTSIGTSNNYVEYDYGTGAILTIRQKGAFDPQSGWIVVDDPKSKAERHRDRLREIIESRQSPMVITSRNKSLKPTPDIREQRARETLRRVLGDDKFRIFVRNGFVTVRAKSGLSYQIFPGHGITAVYDKGQMTERLCVVLAGDFPPTDSLIMRYILILNNENMFRSLAVKHPVNKVEREVPVDKGGKTLPEIYSDIKAGKNPFIRPMVQPAIAKVG